LNKFFRSVIATISMPMYKGRAVKLYYMTQVKTEPPAFVVFANYPDAVKDSLLRFIERGLREHFVFEGTPLKIFIKARRKERGS
jgi:GTPase